MLNDGASAGEFNMHSVPTLEFQLARQAARRNNARVNAGATPTQVGRQPPAGYRCAGMYPATYGSGSKYRSCYSGQRASSLLRFSPSFSSVLLRCLPPRQPPRPSSPPFTLPSYPAYVPDCLLSLPDLLPGFSWCIPTGP